MNLLILLLLPLAAGIALAFMKKAPRKAQDLVFVLALAAEAGLALWELIAPGAPLTLFSMTEALPVTLAADTVSKVFLAAACFGFLPAGVYALRDLREDERQSSFYSLMLFSQSALVGMDLSANLVTMFLFFELATLLSVPLVLHERTEESIRAALKYLFYSVGGALLALRRRRRMA